MADKGLIESARRMYGAKDAARQEAKKDMLRSGEILYRGLRDFGVAKQREDAIRRTEIARQEAMDYRRETFDQTMDFRQKQFDYTKELQNQKIEESRYLEELGSSTTLANLVNEINDIDFFPGMKTTSDNYYNKLSGLNEQKHNRSGDPRAIADEYSKTAKEFSNISGEYKVLTDLINTVTQENPESGQMDLSIFSNEPGSQEALKNITTIIKGMRDKSIDVFGQDGKLMIRGDFNGDGNVTAQPFSELNLQDYILKNNGKAPQLDNIYISGYENGLKGFSADPGLMSAQIMNILQDRDDNAALYDFDPDFDGANKTTFKSYHIPNLKDGTIEQGINPRWGNAQNQWWNYQIESQGWAQVDNVKRNGVTETSWEDNDGNVYVRKTFDENEGVSSWTKNGKPHEWISDDLWSGDNGVGISRKGLFAEWLSDVYAEGINNNENVKEQIARKNNPGKGTDLGIANARNHIIRLAQGIETGDYSIVSGLLNAQAYRTPGDKAVYSTDVTELDDGTTVSNINLRTGASVMPHSATNYTTLGSKNQKMEMLNNIIDEHFGGSDLRTVLGEEGILNMVNQIFTDNTTELEKGGGGVTISKELQAEIDEKFPNVFNMGPNELKSFINKVKNAEAIQGSSFKTGKKNDEGGDEWDMVYNIDGVEFTGQQRDAFVSGLENQVLGKATAVANNTENLNSIDKITSLAQSSGNESYLNIRDDGTVYPMGYVSSGKAIKSYNDALKDLDKMKKGDITNEVKEKIDSAIKYLNLLKTKQEQFGKLMSQVAKDKDNDPDGMRYNISQYYQMNMEKYNKDFKFTPLRVEDIDFVEYPGSLPIGDDGDGIIKTTTAKQRDNVINMLQEKVSGG